MFAKDIRYQTAALSLLATLLLSTAGAHAQVKDRLIEQTTTPGGPLPVPVEILSIKVGDQQVQVSQTFAAADDWMKGMELTFRNTSDKPIVLLAIQLRFPSPDGTPVAFPVFYGSPQSLSSPEETARLAQTQAIKPGETATLTFAERQYDSMMAVLAKRGWELPFDKLTIKVNTVVFADDTSWRYGYQHRRDANDPLMWRVVQEKGAAELPKAVQSKPK